MKVETVKDLKIACVEPILKEPSIENKLYFVGPELITHKGKATIFNQCIFLGYPSLINNEIVFHYISNDEFILIRLNKISDAPVKELSQPGIFARFTNNDDTKLEGISALVHNRGLYTKITGIFSNFEEAEQYLKREITRLKGEVKDKKKELDKYTVTLEQIAQAFNIPKDKLIIKNVYNDVYNR